MHKPILVGGLLLALGGAARAEDVPPVAPSEKDHKKDDKDKPPPVEIGGRVFVRETLASAGDEPWRGELSLESARVEVGFRHKKVRAVVELEAAGKDTEIKDGYLRLDLPERFEAFAGRFKIPLSPIENTSVWKLPSVDRGLLSDLLDDAFRLTGRRIGAMGEWRGDKDLVWQPRVSFGTFQADALDGDPLAGEGEDLLGLDAAARVALAGPGVEIGLAGSSRLMVPAPAAAPERYWAASLDAEVKLAGLRLWAEGYVGSTSKLFDVTPTSGDDPIFVAGRLLAAWRAGGVDSGDWYLEPYVLVSVLEPNLDVSDDLVSEFAGGLAGGRWQRLRAQLQVQAYRKGDNASPLFEAGGESLVDQEAVVLQLGAAF